jgi:hypothetical protein
VLPFLFERTGSRTVTRLNDCMVANRRGTLNPIASDKRLPQ